MSVCVWQIPALQVNLGSSQLALSPLTALREGQMALGPGHDLWVPTGGHSRHGVGEMRGYPPVADEGLALPVTRGGSLELLPLIRMWVL